MTASAEPPTADPALPTPAASGASGSATHPAAPSAPRYEILAELGRGGMGVVHLARQCGLDRRVALKMISAGAEAGPEQVKRFDLEARAAARLHHPGIVGVYDVGEMDGHRYIAMEFVDGRRLDRWVRETGADLRAQVGLLRGVAEAVAHAHAAGIVHRDLKPANVLVDAQGAPHVADFGLAKEVDSAAEGLTRSGSVMGTPHYMSPEQVRASKHVDMRTDVWALGVMLYEALTGKKPFEGEASYEIFAQVMTREPVAPRRWNASVPADLETICLKALDKEPARRYPTAADFAAELSRWLGGEPVLARRPGLGRRAWRWAARRKPLVTGLAAFALVAGGLALWAGLAQQREAEAVARRARVLKEMHDRVSAAVRRFEDTLMSVPMPKEAQRALAHQPLDMLETLVAEDAGFGPLHSWRGEVFRLLEDHSQAEAEFDRGCALSPDSAVVWYLRGMYRIERYARTRSLPGAVTCATGVTFKLRPEQPGETEQRQRGLADLARMAEAAGRDAWIGAEEAKLGRAQAALYRGGEEGWREALDLLAGLNRPKAAKMRGQAHYFRKEFDRAMEEFSRTLSVWKADGETFEHRGFAGYARGMELSARGGDAGECCAGAIADFSRALRGGPEDAEVYGNRGSAYDALGQAESAKGIDPRASYAKAIADYGEALRLDSGYAEAYGNRGAAWSYVAEAEAARGLDPRESYRKAIADFGEELWFDATNAGGYNNRGGAILGVGRAEAARGVDPRESYRKAIADFSEALRRDPELAAAYNNRGNAWSAQAEVEAASGVDARETWRKAIADYGETIRRSPGVTSIYLNRGKAHFQLGEAEAGLRHDAREHYRNSIADAAEALRLDPENGEAFQQRGNGYLYLGQVEAALGVDPRENYGKAVADYAEALRRKPEDGSVYGNRGLCWFSQGEAEAARGIDPGPSFARAEADYREAMQRGDLLGRLNLGLLYRATGRFDAAIAAFEEGAKAAPAYAGWAQQNIEATRRMAAGARLAGEPWGVELAAADRALQAGDRATARKRYEEGLARFEQDLAARTPEERKQRELDSAARGMRMLAEYNLACLLALESARDAAFEHLGRAVDLGWTDRGHLEEDPDLTALHADPRWAAVVGRVGGK